MFTPSEIFANPTSGAECRTERPARMEERNRGRARLRARALRVFYRPAVRRIRGRRAGSAPTSGWRVVSELECTRGRPGGNTTHARLPRSFACSHHNSFTVPLCSSCRRESLAYPATDGEDGRRVFQPSPKRCTLGHWPLSQRSLEWCYRVLRTGFPEDFPEALGAWIRHTCQP